MKAELVAEARRAAWGATERAVAPALSAGTIGRRHWPLGYLSPVEYGPMQMPQAA